MLVARKIRARTQNSGWSDPSKKKKIRKPRKPMTDEQRQAAAERLKKAREARAKKNPNYGKSGLHPSLHDMDEEHHLHPDKVKQWIKTQKDLLRTEKQGVRQKVKGAIARAATHEAYIRICQRYLRDGDWTDNFYGEYQEKKITRRCIAQAYYWYGPKKGQPKFDVGVYYPMLGQVYTQEMYNEDNPPEERTQKNVGKKRKRRTAK